MATTTKKTTRAKTKTATAKTSAAAKTRPAKATAKAAVKPARVATARTKKTGPSKFSTLGTTMFGLRRLHLFAVVLFAALAVAAGVFMTSDTFQLTVGHLAKDDLASTETTVFTPAVKAVYDVEIRWVVVGILAVSAVLPLLYVTRLESRYAAFLRNSRMVPWRWIDLGITAGLMVMTVALLSGVNDIMVLKVLGDIVVVGGLLALIAERQNNNEDKPVWSAFWTGVFACIVPWILIAVYAVSTTVDGGVRYPWFVYALYAVVFGGGGLVVANARKQFRAVGNWKNYMFVERNYVAASVLTKAAFAIVLIVGLR